MARTGKPVNPFYVALVMVGLAFIITACVYVLITVRDLYALRGAEIEPADSVAILVFVERHGAVMLVVELLLLGVTSFGAMATDSYWIRRTAREASETGNQEGGGPPLDSTTHDTTTPPP